MAVFTSASPAQTRVLNVVGVSGSLQRPSRTTVLVEELLDGLAGRFPATTRLIELAELGPELAGAVRRDQVPETAEEQIRAIEKADLLVVATPVYRASFTGLFKHLFDFVGQYSMIDKPVLLAATGGSDRHALILEHQLRPLFGFFQSITLPIGVYANDSSFEDYVIQDELRERIDQVVDRAASFVGRGPEVSRSPFF